MKLTRSRMLVATAIGVLAALAGLILAQSVLRTDAAGTAIISLDTDISDGACVDVDSSRTVNLGQTFQVAVCLINNRTDVPLAGYEFRVLYDGTVLGATGGSNTAPALDANPDANGGGGVSPGTTYTSATYPNHLGGGWDCTAGGIAGPNPDEDGIAGNVNGSAFSGGCGTNAGPAELVVGPVAVLTFTAANANGSTALTLKGVNFVDNNLDEIGTCNLPISFPATCNNATINVGQPNTPTATATRTSTPTHTVPVNTATATATNTVPANTATSTATATNTAPANTATSTATATNTVPGNTATSTATATNTVPANTATSTATATNTVPANTATSTATATNTPEVAHTATQTPTHTSTATATHTPAPVDTATHTPTRTPTATQVPGEFCADVTGEGFVTVRDLVAIAHHLGKRHQDLTYDINGDGRVTPHDLHIAIRQMGEQC